MPDYRKMYLTLFDAVERTLEVLDAPEQDTALAKDLLIAAQQTCEDIYVDTAEGRYSIGGRAESPAPTAV